MQESTEPKGKGRRTPAEEALDQHFGRRLRELRVSRGLTQQQVADVLGTCFQQVQKYETGRDRISASRLSPSPGRWMWARSIFTRRSSQARRLTPRRRSRRA